MRVLADTSVWWSHVARSSANNDAFARRMNADLIVCHPWIHGELLLGGLSPTIARDLLALDFLPVAPQPDVERFIRHYRPQGIGWVDVNLLVSCLNEGTTLWTHDKHLRASAEVHGRSVRE